jgi:phosphoribosylformylglycinamidine synthase
MSYMLILRGAPALSDFRNTKLMQQFAAQSLPINEIYAEFVHFSQLTEALSEPQTDVLKKLLTYGPAIKAHDPVGQLILVVPRAGTISPWSSKATDIVQNCGLHAVTRIERGCAYYVKSSEPLNPSQLSTVQALLHDRMTEMLLTELQQAQLLFV